VRILCISAIVSAFLIGCGPSEEQVQCEKTEGEWKSEFSHFSYIWISDGKGGGYNTMIPVYDDYCDRTPG